MSVSSNTNNSQPPGGEHECTEVGQQQVIPGTERISDAELARRRAASKAEGQSEAGRRRFVCRGANQTDLVDLVGKCNPIKP